MQLAFVLRVNSGHERTRQTDRCSRPRNAPFERVCANFFCEEVALVWKVFGRCVVVNLATLTRWAPRQVDFYVMADDQWVEMSVMAWSARGYRAIVRGLYRQFASQEPPELILRRHLGSPVRDDVKCVLSFRWPVRLFGRRGTDGSPYEGRRTRYRFALQAGWKSLCLPWRRWRDV